MAKNTKTKSTISKKIRKFVVLIGGIVGLIGAIVGVIAAVMPFILPDKDKIAKTEAFLSTYLELHNDVRDCIDKYNSLDYVERETADALKKIEEKQKEILDFYFKLETSISSGLYDEETAKNFLCDYAEAEAYRYFKLLFKYDENGKFMGTNNITNPNSRDLALYRFVVKCKNKIKKSKTYLNTSTGDEPIEIKEYREWLKNQ